MQKSTTKTESFKDIMSFTSAMFLGELMSVPVVQLSLRIDQVQLGGEAHDRAARLPVRQLIAFLPEVVKVCVYGVRKV